MLTRWVIKSIASCVSWKVGWGFCPPAANCCPAETWGRVPLATFDKARDLSSLESLVEPVAMKGFEPLDRIESKQGLTHPDTVVALVAG